MFYWNLLSIYHLWMCKRREFINLKILKINSLYLLYNILVFIIQSILIWNHWVGILGFCYVFMYFHCCSELEERISGCNWWQSTASALNLWWINNRNNEIQIFIILFVIRLLGMLSSDSDPDCDWIIDFRLLVTRREGLQWTGKYYGSLDINRFVTTP